MKMMTILPLLLGVAIQAQFKVAVSCDPQFAGKEAYLYSESGSKDIMLAKADRHADSWTFHVAQPYTGIMKVYIPATNTSLNFISENSDVDFQFSTDGNRIKNVVYRDQPNKTMDDTQKYLRQREIILPALYEMKPFYSPASDFAGAIDREIQRLSKDGTVAMDHNPFVGYYTANYDKYLSTDPKRAVPSQSEVISFLTNTDAMLESSTLLQPILVKFVQNAGKNPETDIDRLIESVKPESPRGQIILSELIDIFDSYGTTVLKDKYLKLASNLKCTISDRLANTIASNKNTEVGAVFPDYKFTAPTNTSAKSIYSINADRKLVIFWSSTCGHCEQELPQIIPFYGRMQAEKIAVVGLSVDADKQSYEDKVKNFPWINDSELRGWHSSYADTYNVHATPTYFILDSKNKIIAKPDHIGDALKFLGLK